MKYLKKFNTHSEYETFKQSAEYIEPNVSVCVNENEVHYNPIVIGSHEYVDLGLPTGTLWATENIKDANGNELYFAWGETQGYTSGQVGTEKNFSWRGADNDYAFGPIDWNDDTNYGMTKYNKTDGKTVLDTTDDAATANWGSDWRMPTIKQFEELTKNTTMVLTQVDGVNGLLFTSTVNTNTLFFPAVGNAKDGNTECIGDEGIYWLVELSDKQVNNAFNFGFKGVKYDVGYLGRYHGCSMRPVRASN